MIPVKVVKISDTPGITKNNFSVAKTAKKNAPAQMQKNTRFTPDLLKNYFISPTFGKTKLSSTQEAENYLKEKFGIKADFRDNLKVADLVVKTFDKLEKQPFYIKNSGLNIAYDYTVFKNRPKIIEKNGEVKETEPFLMMTGGSKTLYINPKFDWDNLEQRLNKNFEKGNLAYKDPMGLVLHEIGHFLHNEANSGKYEAANEEIPEGSPNGLIINQVSKRATSDYGEFVAEVFAAKILGKDFSPEIQKIYKDWAYYGPHIF